MRLAGHGIAVDLPRGWEARVYRRPRGNPIMHAGDFPLPRDDGDFGARAVASMRPDGTFFVLAEYDTALAGMGLFAEEGFPVPIRWRDLDPRALQRTVPGRAGLQRFFTKGGRAFCLYVVVGTARGRSEPADRANRVLSTLHVDPREALW